MEYHFRIHREGRGYWAECVELKGCVTQADTRASLDANMKEALDLYMDEPADSRVVFPAPRKRVSGQNVVLVQVDPKIAFAQTLRSLRLGKRLTQRQVADRLGMKNLYSYQRLESARTANPALSTIAKLKSVFPELKLDQVV
ncbi:MAG: helix-turn-helix domain-containing protein [Spirochaetales bacterium]|nr:helix-turn-helix domain-containing protein [Leptospiraceae bacterium]MCP5480624.1 helix-turn-helix domain-containing protein [Spirochaetales bacterium]MCP5483976.1 helix-turn-helix domain-containing protein [Spirochaetales bacterium]